jgi:hypothetical protein
MKRRCSIVAGMVFLAVSTFVSVCSRLDSIEYEPKIPPKQFL